eukprot:2220857-Amphidinium_carterae.1
MALGRARFSDTAYAEEVVFDEDDAGEIKFVEMRTRHFKTAKVVGMEGEFLCLIAPALGVSG